MITTESLIVDIPNIIVTTTEPLVTLVQNACIFVEKAKKTAEQKDIEAAEIAISSIYDDYCHGELEYELKNLKKSLELPLMITKLERMFENGQDKFDFLQVGQKEISKVK